MIDESKVHGSHRIHAKTEWKGFTPGEFAIVAKPQFETSWHGGQQPRASLLTIAKFVGVSQAGWGLFDAKIDGKMMRQRVAPTSNYKFARVSSNITPQIVEAGTLQPKQYVGVLQRYGIVVAEVERVEDGTVYLRVISGRRGGYWSAPETMKSKDGDLLKIKATTKVATL